MQATIVIAELIAVGLLGFASLFLLVIHPFYPELEPLLKTLLRSKDLIGPISIVGALMAYYFGWIINGVCYSLLQDPLFGEPEKRKLLGKDTPIDAYRAVHVAAFQKIAPNMMTELMVDRAVLRLSRCGLLIFPAMAVGLVCHFPGISILFLVIFAACFVQLRS
jgi:hypothetical protein